jgi:hypothetical protein
MRFLIESVTGIFIGVLVAYLTDAISGVKTIIISVVCFIFAIVFLIGDRLIKKYYYKHIQSKVSIPRPRSQEIQSDL